MLWVPKELPPDDRIAKRPLGRVVGRFDDIVVDERPEPLPVFVELGAHAYEPLVA
jgi:hypothetical protein